MTKAKALFFDIDGTLVSFKTHRIPESAVEALQRARTAGLKIYISTGRPVPFIVNLGQISHLIDGYITTNGALCIVGKEKFGCHNLRKDDAERVLEGCRKFGRACVVVGTEHIAVFQRSPEVDEQFGTNLGLKNFPFAGLEAVLREPLLQVSPFFTPEEEAQVVPQLRECISARWSNFFTDITHTGADKGRGLLTLCAHEGLDVSETIAFGDGGNDISILRRAGTGVAMGNAKDNVKAVADYVTTSVDNDGISRALAQLCGL
ncbi:MAG: Cof-type HAD-IIB family hydrolase [Prevotella sp.]